jgi:hypothetical protein
MLTRKHNITNSVEQLFSKCVHFFSYELVIFEIRPKGRNRLQIKRVLMFSYTMPNENNETLTINCPNSKVQV